LIVFRGNNRLLKFTVKGAHWEGAAGKRILLVDRKGMVHFKTFGS